MNEGEMNEEVPNEEAGLIRLSTSFWHFLQGDLELPTNDQRPFAWAPKRKSRRWKESIMKRKSVTGQVRP